MKETTSTIASTLIENNNLKIHHNDSRSIEFNSLAYLFQNIGMFVIVIFALFIDVLTKMFSYFIFVLIWIGFLCFILIIEVTPILL